MRAVDAIASIAVFAVVLFFGTAADFDSGSKVDFALGVVTATLAFLIADRLPGARAQHGACKHHSGASEQRE